MGTTMSSALATLYDHADALLKLAPWEWMEEVELIAFRHPALPEMAHLSVMGSAGEHRSLGVYLGDEALHRFNLVQEAAYVGMDLDPEDQLALMMESRQLQVSFTARNQLERYDLDQIKSLGRKYRGKVWPQFRSMIPGRAPGPLTDLEVEVLAAAIEQILNVATRLKAGTVANSRRTPRFQILGRELGPDHQWRDFWYNFDDDMYRFPTPGCDLKLAGEVAQMGAKVDLLVAFNLMMTPVGPRFGEQVYPYVLMAVDGTSGQMVGVEMLAAETSTHAELMAAVANTLLRMLKEAGARPVRLRTTSLRAASLLASMADALEIPLQREKKIPALKAAVQGLQRAMMGGLM